MSCELERLHQRLDALADPDTARTLSRFFKTGPREYGEGDRFLGVRVPVLRKLAREFQSLSLEAIETLLRSAYHEHRLLALLLLVRAYERGDERQRQQIYRLYLDNTVHINNWDLVDTSAEHIVGAHLSHRSHRPLTRLARSRSVWERRIAMLATFHFVKRGEFQPTLEIAEMLLNDSHDLIHKAAGWMLREVGKCDQSVATRFLDTHYPHMPRTMLRYAIERLPATARQRYLTTGQSRRPN